MHRVWPPFSKSKESRARRSTSVVLSGRAGGGTISSLPRSTTSCSSSSTCSVEPLSASLQYKTRKRTKRPSCGKGEFQWASGLSYKGEFKGDKREGYGRLTWPDGSSYEGYFRNDLREGLGIHKWEDSGEVYEGCYHNDKRHGQGIYHWPSGASFTGTFKEDLKSGTGTYVSPHGERYEGVYNNDVRDGEGVLSYPGGRQDIGIWRGRRLTHLKFVIKEIALDPKISRHSSLKASHGLYTPDLESRGKAGPKGYLEVASQEFIQEAALGNLKKVKAILETGAVYVDVVDGKGNSALFAAAMNGRADVVNYLLDNGADVNRVNNRGISILNACHHAFFCHHPRVRVLLDQLHLLLHSTATTGSSTLSSRSDISDTETLFTSDFASTPRTSITGDSARRRGGRFIFDSEFALEAPPNTLTRCRSMIELDQLGSGSLLPQHGLLGRVRSFPTLRPGGYKHVRFISRADEEEEEEEREPSLESLNELSSSYHNDGISSQATEGLVASGTSLHESSPIEDECSLYNSGILGTSEMYVPYDKLCGGKQFQSVSSFRGSTDSVANQNQAGRQQDSSKGVLRESNGGNGPSKRRPQNLDFTTSPPAGNFVNVPEGSVTASAAGEVMGVSALNSESSPNCPPESSEAKHPFSKKLEWTKQGKKGSFSTGSNTPTDVEGSQVSLPNISQQRGSMVQFNGCATPPASLGTPSSVHTRPSTGYAHHQLPNSNAKSLPVLRHSSKKPNHHHHHHHPNKLLTFPDELHGSSVFSSTRYGSIVSAAQSMTLSSYAGSEVDVTESSTSPSAVSVAQEPARCRSVDVSHVIWLLLSRGANPNISSIPLNPMFYTILGGEVDVVKKLLESGAKTDQHLPDELGGYTLLHIAMANIGPFSPHIVELLLQYGADPSSGGRSIERRVMHNESDEDTTDSSDEEEGEEERDEGEDKRMERLIPGKNEGSAKVTPLHMLCSVHINKEENKAELFELVPTLIEILIKYGADVNAVANGHSPLALAILHGHDTAIDVLLKNGANPDLPLGKGVGNAICALTTHPAHKCRVILSTTPHSLSLLHRLIVEGANVFIKVKLAKGGVGTILDFAHLAFQEDRRLSGLRYDHLTKRERARYRSAKRIITYIRSIFRCMALHNLATKMNLLYILDMKIRADRSNNDSRNIELQRFLATTTAHDKTGSLAFQSSSKGRLSSTELLKNVKPHVIWLPEMTISLSLTLLSKTINQETASDKDVYIEEHVTASLLKKKGRLSRFVRYKELIEMAGRILKFYKMDGGMKSWNFSSFCYECGKSFGVYLTECCGCQIVSYCSKNCKTENWRKGHKDECPKLDLKSPSKCSSSSSRESTGKRGKGPKLKSKPGI